MPYIKLKQTRFVNNVQHYPGAICEVTNAVADAMVARKEAERCDAPKQEVIEEAAVEVEEELDADSEEELEED